MVAVGKGLGNGFPVAGLVVTRELGQCFDNGMEYFNTFGELSSCLGTCGYAWIARGGLGCSQAADPGLPISHF